MWHWEPGSDTSADTVTGSVTQCGRGRLTGSVTQTHTCDRKCHCVSKGATHAQT